MADRLSAFVSYSSKDREYVRRFVEVLRSAGIEVWFDENNLAAGAFVDTINRAIISSHVFIVILTPNALESRWVQMEIDAALSLSRREQTRIFLPVIAAPISDSDIPLMLTPYKHIKSYSPDEAAQQVLRALGITVDLKAQGLEELIARGATLRAGGDLVTALNVLGEAVERAPYSVDAWANFGLALAEARQIESALTAFNQALAMDPVNEFALQGLGDTLLASGRYLEAIAVYDRVLKHNHNHVMAWYNRGTALLALRNFGAAVENYQTIQELDPTNSDAYMFQADALWQVGRRREAIDAYEQAIELKPGSLGDLTRPIRTLIRRYH